MRRQLSRRYRRCRSAPEPFQIRRLEEGDLEAVCRHLPERSCAEQRERLEWQDRGSFVCFIAWTADAPVGHVGLVLPDVREVVDTVESRGSPILHDLEVVPAHRRRGIGRALAWTVESEARARGSVLLGLRTGIDDGYAAARALYRSLGWVEEPDSLCLESARIPTDEGSYRVYIEVVAMWWKELQPGRGSSSSPSCSRP